MIEHKFKVIYVIVLVLCCAYYTNAANILILESCPSPSHHLWIKTLAIKLAGDGHNVTSISADHEPKQIHPNLHYIYIEDYYSTMLADSEGLDFIEYSGSSPFLNIVLGSLYFQRSTELILQSQGVQTLLNYPDDFKFDLIMRDWLISPALNGFMHKFNYPPTIGITAYGSISSTLKNAGSPISVITTNMNTPYMDLSFTSRAANFVLFIIEMLVNNLYTNSRHNRLGRKIFPNAPDLTDLDSIAEIVLINNHPAIDSPEPIMPSIIPVGGMQLTPPKGLPEDLKTIADSAPNSLILFSLGTNMRSDRLGEHRIKIIIETFASLPQYTFLWKFESTDLPVKIPKNVHIRKFLPQKEILAHPNTILFMTHSGLMSTQESIWYGVPMICLPIFADQFLNADQIVRIGIGERYDLKTLNQKDLSAMVHNICTNSTYRENAKLRSKNFHDQKESPLERAVWWVEYILRNKEAKFLESPLKQLNYIEKQGIDVILFVFCLWLVSFYVFLKIFWKILRTVYIKSMRPKNKTTKTD